MKYIEYSKSTSKLQKALESGDSNDNVSDFPFRASNPSDELTAKGNHSIAQLDNGDNAGSESENLSHGVGS
jgi:hypothetical protein